MNKKLANKLAKQFAARYEIARKLVNEFGNTRSSVVLPDDLNIRAATVSPETLSSNDRTVSATLATDSAVPVFDSHTFDIIDEVLLTSGMLPVDRVNLLRDHNRSTVLAIQGDVHSIRTTANTIDGTLQFGRNLDPESEAIYNRVEQGFLRTVSAGYAYSRNDCVEIQPGQTATVDGRTFTAGARMMRVCRKWRLREVSLVVIPADELAQLRGASDTAKKSLHNQSTQPHAAANATNTPSQPGTTEPPAMHPLHTFLRGLGLGASATVEQIRSFALVLTDAQRAEAAAIIARHGLPADVPTDLFAAPSNPPVTTPVSSDVNPQRSAPNGGVAPTQPSSADVIAHERTRQSTIRNLASSDIAPELVERALNEGWSIEQAGIQFASARSASRPQPLSAGGQAPFGHVVNNSVTLQSMQAALLQREGVNLDSPSFASRGAEMMMGRNNSGGDWICHAGRALSARGNFPDEVSRSIESARSMRSWGTREFARACLMLSNERAPEDDTELFQRAISTQAWNALFTTNMNAQLLMGYDEAPDTTAPLVRDVEVDNFLTQDRTQAGKFSGMRREGTNSGDANVVNGGTTATESYKLERFVGAMEYDDKAFINNTFNNLGELTNREMGAMAKRLPADLVYGILMGNPNMADGNPLFTGNNAMTGAPLNAANLQTAWTRMGTQTQDGVPLGIFAQNLVTGVANYFNSKNLLESTVLVGGSSAAPDKNVLNGLFGHIYDSRIDNGVLNHNLLTPTLIAGVPTTWFVTAAGGRYTIERGWLRGSGMRPRLIDKPLEGRRIGRMYMVYVDCQAKPLSRLGMLRAVAT